MNLCMRHSWAAQGAPFNVVHSNTGSFFQGWLTLRYQLWRCGKCGKVQRKRLWR